ncbi:MAG TPA: FRG domain-containing protein [Tahibacter sp.]|nr:FRG domain-containing protein [Tahibacter sp.]
MPIAASDYYKAFDKIIASLTELRTQIDAIDQFARDQNLRVFWRGQLDHRWGLTSSLVRKLSVAAVPDDVLLNKVEERIVNDSLEWVSALQIPPYDAGPLAQLAYMQHHGVPTRLLDFTRNPWVAVFFAVETGDDIDGRVFAILVEENALITGVPPGYPWRTYGTDEIKIWDPVPDGIAFPRLVAQSGVLAVGRLPSTQPHRAAWDSEINDERSLLAEEVRRIMSIPIKLCTDPVKTCSGVT